ncbi:MAG TPA: ABC transporter permease [Opitutaceae bacterium]|jgi:putative ABC transport system permease protein|nr:ABC transporter permease [Opitutaceae bacterium]
MRFLSTILVALRALRRNKMRSILTALGIIIGVAAVIAMVSIGNGAEAQVEAQIASLGQNIILVFAGSANSGGARSGYGGAGSLTIDDALAIKNEVRDVSAVSPEVRGGAQVLANGLNWFTRIVGESEDYLSMREWPLSAGTDFTEQDVRSAAKVCILGQTIVNQLFPEGDPIGKSIRIRNLPFKVVGVLSAKGFSLQGTDQDDMVIIPYTSAMKRFSKQTFLPFINVQAASSDRMANAEQDITGLLRDRHHITQGKDDDFTVRDQQEIAEAATATTRTMTFLLGAIAGVSLLVGGIGIMNIMLVSVTERTREIGIRMAVGAHGSDIRMQFLIEAVVLSLMGGTLGILLGVGASQFLSRLNNWPTLISTVAIAAAFLFSGAVGICFGYYPASKAAKLDPIDALRYE